MSTKKRRTRKKKTEQIEEPKVELLDPITDEEPPTVNQPFIEPEQLIHEESSDLNEELVFTIAQLPAPLISYTQRQMGEEFMPEYSKLRHKLRRLAGLTNGIS